MAKFSDDKLRKVNDLISRFPPRPEAVLDGFMRVQELVGKENLRRRNTEKYKELLAGYGIQ